MLNLLGSYSKQIPHTFLQFTSNTTDILQELLVQNTTHCSRVYIKQYWHFKKVSSKLNYSKNFFPEFISQDTNTLRKLLSHNIDLLRAWISNSIHTLTELLPNNIEHFFEFQWTLEHTEYTQTENSLVKVKKVAYTHETDNFAFNYSSV